MPEGKICNLHVYVVIYDMLLRWCCYVFCQSEMSMHPSWRCSCLDLGNMQCLHPVVSELKECGLTLRVLHQADISWGTYSDSCWNPNRSKLLSQHCRWIGIWDKYYAFHAVEAVDRYIRYIYNYKYVCVYISIYMINMIYGIDVLFPAIIINVGGHEAHLRGNPIHFPFTGNHWYCGWKKSCTTWDG